MLTVIVVSPAGVVPQGTWSEVYAEELVWDLRGECPGIVVAAIPLDLPCRCLADLVRAVALVSMAETMEWAEVVA